MDALLPIAAILHEHHDGADALLRDFAAQQRGLGVAVRGLVMIDAPMGRRRAKRRLQDLHTGRIFDIFQDLGAESRACCLDISCLAAASATLCAALEARPDLVVVNRFGRQEAEGGGFAQEFLNLMAEGIPVLTIVSGDFLEDWRRFTGGMGVELPVDLGELTQWATRVLQDGGFRASPIQSESTTS